MPGPIGREAALTSDPTVLRGGGDLGLNLGSLRTVGPVLRQL